MANIVTSTVRPADLAAQLARFERRPSAQDSLTPASVAVCVTVTPDGPSLVITRRAATLRAHAGQWALPGGRRDPGETAEQAALRELTEETGVIAGPGAILGQLDDYVTRSGYVITPVVVWAGPSARELSGPPDEVAHIFQVPLTDLDVEPRFVRLPEAAGPVIRLPLLGNVVHAPTAAIIYQFCQVALHGNPVRVAHLEAPARLWR